jgi:hypothetical protein
MASKTTVVNMALSHLGISTQIADVDTETSKEAKVARIFFDTVRDATLSDAEWPWARKTADLSLIESNPNDEWLYSYAYPSDCVKAIKIPSGYEPDTNSTKIKYEINGDATYGSVIYTNAESAQLKYVYRHTDIDHWPSDFVLSVAYHLAFYMAPQLTAGDQHKLGERAMKLYQIQLGKAKKKAFNDEVTDEDIMSDSEAARS